MFGYPNIQTLGMLLDFRKAKNTCLAAFCYWFDLMSFLFLPSSPLQLPLSLEVPKVFATLPEYYIEDIAEFLIFLNM